MDPDETKIPRQRQRPTLPPEIIDIILENLYCCALHRWSCPKRPCQNWHTPTKLPPILPLRLVCKYFNEKLTPSIFSHITCTGTRRHQLLKELSRDKLSAHVHTLRIDIAPQDLGNRMKRVNNALVTVERKLLHYFEILPIFFVPLLKRFESLRVLHITTTYLGIMERNIPKNEAMDPCLAALCKSVKQAQLQKLEELTLGVPYLGGYTHFFEDIDEKKHGKMLKACASGLRTASVKLFDNMGNFTTMPFF